MPVLGVVYNQFAMRCSGASGAGRLLERKPDKCVGVMRIERSPFRPGFLDIADSDADSLDHFRAFQARRQFVLWLGGAGLMPCVACGRQDGFWEMS